MSVLCSIQGVLCINSELDCFRQSVSKAQDLLVANLLPKVPREHKKLGTSSGVASREFGPINDNEGLMTLSQA